MSLPIPSVVDRKGPLRFAEGRLERPAANVNLRHHGLMRILTIVAVLLAATAAAASGAAKPRVTVDSVSPIAVAGAGFPDRAAVHVTVSAGTTHLQRTGLTSPTGTFRMRWTITLHPPRCDGIAIAAVSGKTRVLLKFGASKAGCAPPLAP